MKAAYLHAQHPEWTIVVTFQSRALHQQFKDLILRFSFEYLGDEPDWKKLRVLHSWGGTGREGVYSELARHAGVVARDFLYGRSRFGRDGAFAGVCSELLSATAHDEARPIFDAVLIDEAQDLPPAFFQLIRRFTCEPKRIVWAYDDLQKLDESVMPSLGELFGVDENGEPLLHLSNTEGARQDIVLRICYRNPPWTLTVAHALGLGIYREGGLVQHFDDPTLWTEIGYRLLSGRLAPGERVTLERAPDSYPSYFTELLSADDVVIHKAFDDPVEQAAWVASSIERNVKADELDLDDILVVLPNALTARQEARPVMTALGRLGISAHLAGVTTSVDEIFDPESIALAHIHRSKGNEAAMVYVINAEQCLSGPELVALRNTIFTAITRSKAWVRICGIGQRMAALQAEVDRVISANYALRFENPHRRATLSDSPTSSRTVSIGPPEN